MQAQLLVFEPSSCVRSGLHFHSNGAGFGVSTARDQSPSHRVKECNGSWHANTGWNITFSPLVIGSRSVTDLLRVRSLIVKRDHDRRWLLHRSQV